MTERVAVVTGAGGGIGREIALALARADHSLALVDGVKETVAVTAEAIGAPDRVEVVVADLRQQAGADRMVSSALDRFGRLEILVNTVGVNGKRGRLAEISDEEWHRVIDGNLTVAFNCSRAVLPVMIRQGYGRIVNLASRAGVSGSANNAHYGAAKAGIIALTKSVAMEGARFGVTANAIAPGTTDTAGARALWSAEEIEGIARRNPMGRIGKPADVAAVAAFLVSDRAEYISGQVVHVNGGALMP